MGYTLRVSVLDQCQLRCKYCLPKKNSPTFLKKAHWLTLVQYEKIACAMVPLSIEKIRFTGGEPLLRKDLPSIMHIFSRVFENKELALTTNGIHFLSVMNALISCGLKSVTFHLDTLREERYESIMGKGRVKTVLHAIENANKAGLKVKINMVVQKNVNHDELLQFLQLSKEIKAQVRFIELMNTGLAKDYVQQTFMSGADILHEISKNMRITPRGRKILTTPATLFLAHDLGVEFGLIASDTQPFCNNCNRLRLSADGRLRVCLYEPLGCSLNSLPPPSDDDLIKNIAHIVAKKTSFHPTQKKQRDDFSMSQIGG